MGYQLGIDAVSNVRGTSTVTIIRDGRFVETRHLQSFLLADWPRLISEIASDLDGPVEVRVDSRGVGFAVLNVLKDAGVKAIETRPDVDAMQDGRLRIRGLV